MHNGDITSIQWLTFDTSNYILIASGTWILQWKDGEWSLLVCTGKWDTRDTWYCGTNNWLHQTVKHPSAVWLNIPDDKASASRVKPKNWPYKLISYHKSHRPGSKPGRFGTWACTVRCLWLHALWQNSIKVLLYTKLKQNKFSKKWYTKNGAWLGINISFRSVTLIWNINIINMQWDSKKII
jgi:hypothetical protein